jgi:hypothetical protein
MDIGDVMPGGGAMASGKRASKIGTGGLPYGPGGGGDPGVSRENRWSIIYPPGQTAEEYARQLDGLGVELGVVQGNQMVYVSHFSAAQPTIRSGSGQGDNRLYFLWQGGSRKKNDVDLLRKAGINVGSGNIFQFYPKGVEDTLAQLEYRFKGRRPSEIRKTRFSVVPSGGGGYTFRVEAQEVL